MHMLGSPDGRCRWDDESGRGSTADRFRWVESGEVYMDRRLRRPKSCEECDSCIYVGEGDFFCESRDEMVIEDWVPLREPCKEGRS